MWCIYGHYESASAASINSTRWREEFYTQGDRSPDNVKFHDSSLSVRGTLLRHRGTHIMSVLVLLSVVGVGTQQFMSRNHIFNI